MSVAVPGDGTKTPVGCILEINVSNVPSTVTITLYISLIQGSAPIPPMALTMESPDGSFHKFADLETEPGVHIEGAAREWAFPVTFPIVAYGPHWFSLVSQQGLVSRTALFVHPAKAPGMGN